jgi:hypothetical protein
MYEARKLIGPSERRHRKKAKYNSKIRAHHHKERRINLKHEPANSKLSKQHRASKRNVRALNKAIRNIVPSAQGPA